MHLPHREPRLSPALAERKLAAAIQLAAIGVFALLAAPFLLGRVYVADDLGEFHLPLRNFYAQQLAAGEPFDWMSELFGGFDVGAEGQLGAYHPWHLALYRWLPLGAAFDVELLASYPFAFVGMFLFLRRALGRRDAASLGALAFTFCGFNLLHFVHPNAIAIVAHLPWLLWAIGIALTTSDRRHEAAAEAAVALLTASQLLLGYPQYVWFSLLAETGYVLWHLAAQRTSRGRAGLVVLAISLGVAIGALQWIPTWHALATSVRQSPDAAFANSGSLHPLNLVQLLAPYLFATRVVGQNTHELGLYLGAVPLVLCVWLAAEWRGWRRRELTCAADGLSSTTHAERALPLVRPLAIGGAMALLLAAGQYGGLYRVQLLLPIVNRFRFPCRAIVLVEFVVAALAAIGFALVSERSRSVADVDDDDRPNRALNFTMLASVAVAVVGPLAWPQYVAAWPLVWIGPVLIAAAATLVKLAASGKQWALIALVVLAAIDLGSYGLSYAVLGRTADLNTYVADSSRPPGTPRVRVAAGGDRAGHRTGDRMLLAGVTRIDGYAGLEPAKRLDYHDLASVQLAGANWLWNRGDDIAEDRRWAPVEPTAPRARLVARAVSPDGVAAIPGLESDTVTCEPPVELPVDASAEATAHVVVDRPGRIAVDVSTHSRRVLVTTESFDAGWQATADGRGRPVVRVDGDFLGCLVEPGDSRLELVFRPPWRLAGAIVSACGLQLLVCLVWLRTRRGVPLT